MKMKLAKQTLYAIFFLVICVVLGFLSPASAQESEDDTEKYLSIGSFSGMYQDSSFKDADCRSNNPVPLYGCEKDANGKVRQGLVEFKGDSGVQISYGERINSMFRFEGTLSTVRNLNVKGETNFLEGQREDLSASVDVTALSLWGFADTFKFNSFLGGKIRFFGGLGVGVASVYISETIIDFPATYTIIPAGTKENTTFGGSVGLSHTLGEDFSIDVVWRYMDYGNIRTSRGGGVVIYRDGRPSLPLNLDYTKGPLKGSEVLVSFRFLL